MQESNGSGSRSKAPKVAGNSSWRSDADKKAWKPVNQSYAQVVKNGRAGSIQQASEDTTVHVRTKVESTSWLEGCFVGRLIRSFNMQAIKESFMLGALVGTFIEVDEACVAKDVLEYVRLCVSIPLGGEAKLDKQIRINNTLCQISIEEESPISDSLQRCMHCYWDVENREESEVDSEANGGDVFLESIYSDFDGEKEEKKNEECTVQFPLEEKGRISDNRGDACKSFDGGAKVMNSNEVLVSMENLNSDVGNTKKGHNWLGNVSCSSLRINEKVMSQKGVWSDDLICVGPIQAHMREESWVRDSVGAKSLVDVAEHSGCVARGKESCGPPCGGRTGEAVVLRASSGGGDSSDTATTPEREADDEVISGGGGVASEVAVGSAVCDGFPSSSIGEGGAAGLGGGGDWVGGVAAAHSWHGGDSVFRCLPPGATLPSSFRGDVTGLAKGDKVVGDKEAGLVASRDGEKESPEMEGLVEVEVGYGVVDVSSKSAASLQTGKEVRTLHSELRKAGVL
ncbi:hypothetical protein VNO80_19649 [Phaseolus coccineus]|uniref:Uncharacterized protein n=1 Tax=Phaseolus coccineus TaxID=3886 RepID=A0AAN9MGE4_PHACN